MNRNMNNSSSHLATLGYVTIRRLLTLFSLLISYKNQNQQCNKKVLIPRSAGERETTARGGAWRRGEGGIKGNIQK